MMDGAFVERVGRDRHIGLRSALLGLHACELPACWVSERATAGALSSGLPPASRRALEQSGVALVALDEPLSNRAFRGLGETLGVPLVEGDPSVQPFVEEHVILNVVDTHPAGIDASLQPFSKGLLSLHSESSGRSLHEQPRYIVLMCCQAPQAMTADTVLVPMNRVAERLSVAEREVLARTRYRRNSSAPYILRTEAGRSVFSFRDFMADTLEWVHDGAAAAAEVNAALARLLASMYEPAGASTVRWFPGLLAVVDNTFVFHGRRAGSIESCRERRLKRLRLLPHAEPGVLD